MQATQTLYTTEVTTTTGRDGKAVSSDGKLDLQLSVPKELGGLGGDGTNPEQLFAAGYAACFGSALKLVAGKQKLSAQQIEVRAQVGLSKPNEAYALSVALFVKIPGLEKAQVEQLMKAAHEVCPYSVGIKGNIEVQLNAE